MCKETALKFAISMIQDAYIVLVHLDAEPINLALLIEPRVAIRAEGNQVLKGMLMRFCPRNNVRNFRGRGAAGGNFTSVASFNQDGALEGFRDRWSAH